MTDDRYVAFAGKDKSSVVRLPGICIFEESKLWDTIFTKCSKDRAYVNLDTSK